MAITDPSLSSIDIQESKGDVRIEMLEEEPIVGARFRPQRIPGQIAGFYDGTFNTVSLYIVNAAGERWLRLN